jgi:hypothetical protein
MTDNGSCYRSNAFRAACKRRGLRQIFTKPYTPKTNGKAERFIQTALREWAYARAYHSSDQRTAELPNWLHRYNWHRPHGSLKANTPISRLALSEDNLFEAPQLARGPRARGTARWPVKIKRERSTQSGSTKPFARRFAESREGAGSPLLPTLPDRRVRAARGAPALRSTRWRSAVPPAA